MLISGQNLQPAYVTTFWHLRELPVSNTDNLGVKEIGEYLRVTDCCRHIFLLLSMRTCSEDSTAALFAHLNLVTDNSLCHQQPIKESACILAMQCVINNHALPAGAKVSGSEAVK